MIDDSTVDTVYIETTRRQRAAEWITHVRSWLISFGRPAHSPLWVHWVHYDAADSCEISIYEWWK